MASENDAYLWHFHTYLMNRGWMMLKHEAFFKHTDTYKFISVQYKETSHVDDDSRTYLSV